MVDLLKLESFKFILSIIEVYFNKLIIKTIDVQCLDSRKYSFAE